jgi:hypothetical protein
MLGRFHALLLRRKYPLWSLCTYFAVITNVAFFFFAQAGEYVWGRSRMRSVSGLYCSDHVACRQ